MNAPAILPPILILGSAILHAIFNAVLKTDGDRYVRRALGNIGAAAIAAPFTLVVPFPTAEAWMHLGVSAVVIAVYQMAQIESYKLGDLSAIYPVARGASVALTAVGAGLLFVESFPLLKIVGLAVAVTALMAFRSGDGGARGPALAWALLTAGLIAIYTLNDAAGVKVSPVMWSYIAWFFVVQGVATPTAVAIRRGRGFIEPMRTEARTAVILSMLMIASYALNLIALRLGAVAEIAALRETSVVFGALIGAYILHEGGGLGPRRVIASTALVVGLMLVHIA